MPQQVRHRKQRTVAYVSNNKQPELLSRGMVLRELYLRLKGQPTLTGANNTVANTAKGDEWGVIRRLDIILNNTDVIRSFSGDALWWLNYLIYGARPKLEVTLGDGATANPSFDSTLVLPFWSFDTKNSMDTALDTRGLADAKIEVTWGDYTHINSAATGFTTNPTLEIKSLESFDIEGKLSQQRVYTIERDISASNPKLQIQLPVGPVYRGFVINTFDNSGDNAAILNNVKWQSGSTVFADYDAKVLNEITQIRKGLDRNFSGTAYTKDRISTKSTRNAWYFLEQVTDGFITESIDTLGYSEHELELDVTVGGAGSKVQVIPIQLYPIRGEK